MLAADRCCTILFIFSHFSMSSATAAPSRVVRVAEGDLQGAILTSESGKGVETFLNIPYAKPPVGPLRFKKPEQAENWEGIRDATSFGSAAIQIPSIVKQDVNMAEDCLTLNVFAPAESAPSEGYPVLVLFHGGGFIIGHAQMYSTQGLADVLVSKGVVIVSVQARLGFLGYWRTADNACVPNLSHWDQIAALKWIKKNIRAFGGNEDNITLCGQSSGSSSVDLLHLSPISTGLFHKYIAMGCSMSNWWAVDEKTVESCEKKARDLGVKQWKNGEDMLQQLRALPADKFKTEFPPTEKYTLMGISIAPSFDNELLPEPISELRKKAKPKPFMIGVGMNEGLAVGMMNEHLRNPNATIIRELVDTIFPKNMSQRDERMEQYIKMFIDLSAENDRTTLVRALTEIASDAMMNFGAYTAMSEAAKHQPPGTVFSYIFNHVNPESWGPMASQLPFMAAGHGADIPYFLNSPFFGKFKFTEKDKKVATMSNTVLLNFLRYGFVQPQVESRYLTKGLPVTRTDIGTTFR
ncbi:hypothetical protein WR25_00197 isoform C [Diploscapter pachys]|uniref:Carboxylic ester hydrolase n=2 Tax=Diploscapter pachys TaxID=2018661 RepID=A0A2A2J490_9BILA|nr:hypothetical protein WR25_00197 isoform C [Diploscapter pachys]